MKYKNLKQNHFEAIRQVYKTSENREKVQEELSDMFNVSKRTIRRWAKKIGVGVMTENVIKPAKIMVYDIETSRIPAWVWWTGKQYVSHNQLIDEPKIITVAWKWLGEDTVYHLVWDKDHSDEKLVEEFGKEYCRADMVIGQNNDRFDNRWLNARLAKHNLPTNRFIRSFDIMKQAKRMFRIPSYSMKYMCEYFGVEQKLSHEGIIMWDKIQTGSPKEQEEYLKKMVDYNVGDIVSTEALYYRLREYFGHKIHVGVLNDGEKFSCPDCGGLNIDLDRTTVTPAGTIQRIMKCNDDGITYKITNRQYMKFIEYKLKNKLLI